MNFDCQHSPHIETDQYFQKAAELAWNPRSAFKHRMKKVQLTDEVPLDIPTNSMRESILDSSTIYLERLREFTRTIISKFNQAKEVLV